MFIIRGKHLRRGSFNLYETSLRWILTVVSSGLKIFTKSFAGGRRCFLIGLYPRCFYFYNDYIILPIGRLRLCVLTRNF